MYKQYINYICVYIYIYIYIVCLFLDILKNDGLLFKFKHNDINGDISKLIGTFFFFYQIDTRESY